METFAALLPSSSNAATLQQTFFMALGKFGAKGCKRVNDKKCGTWYDNMGMDQYLLIPFLGG